MRFLIDMSLPPSWIEALKEVSWQAVHWSQVGPGNATDTAIIAWAAEHDYVVLTHDLDFSRLLALSNQYGPSIVQIRTPRVLPDMIGPAVIAALSRYQTQLDAGAILTIDVRGARVRVLPIKRT